MPDEGKAEGRVALDGQATEKQDAHRSLRSGRRRGPILLLALVLAAATLYFGGIEIHKRIAFISEEDARIQADLVTVSSRVAGWITEIPVAEGDRVQEGSVMVQVDDRESQILLSELEAQLAAQAAERERLEAERVLVDSQVESRMMSEKSQVAAAQVAVSSLRPQRELAARELDRAKRLFEDKVASRRQLDQAETQHQQIDREYRIAVAALEAARARMAEAEAERARLDVLAADVQVQIKREAEIRARVERQRLDIVDRTVKSPVAGVVDKIFVDVGEYVTPGQRLALAHNPEKVWIEANVKETQVRKLAPGQPVNIRVDAYPDETFSGTVQTVGTAATSQFALLPTPNPSGNFTKITQRLPVRIAFDETDPRLRPGMMVEIEISVTD